MLDRGTLGRSDSVFAGPPAWLRDGDIVIAPATVTKFNTWYQVNGAITVAGKDLTEWAKWAAANDELSGGVCGTSISARALQGHVFAKDPAARDIRREPVRPHPAAWLRQPASCLGGRRRPARVHGNRVLVGDTPPVRDR